MLDYKSSRKRYFFTAAAAFILVICPIAYHKIDESKIHNPLGEKISAKLLIDGSNKIYSIYFQQNKNFYTCPVSRCSYNEWRSDVNKIVKIRTDANNQIAEIESNGKYVVSAKDIEYTHFKWLLVFYTSLAFGIIMLRQAFRIHDSKLNARVHQK